MYYFTGENTFALREERQAWERQFLEKHGVENLCVLEASDVRYRSLLDMVGIAPFIASKRLCVIKGTPVLTKEEAESLPTLMHPDCILLMVDAHPDKRLAAVKVFLKEASVKEFPPLQGTALQVWMVQYAQQHGGTLLPAAAEKLRSIVGDDQDVLAQELQKICLFATGRPVTASDVEQLAVPSGEQEIWHLTQLLSQGRRVETLQYARALMDRGEDPFALWNILLWTLKNLLLIVAAHESGEVQPAKLASNYHIPFPTVRTLAPLASRMNVQQAKDLLAWAVDADVQLKTGGYRSTREAPQELQTLIDRFLLLCTDVSVAA